MQRQSRHEEFRVRTRAMHDRLDAIVGGFDTPQDYARYLQASYAFRRPVEDWLTAFEQESSAEPLSPVRLADALLSDLSDLAVELPVTSALTNSFDGDRLWGLLYVLEGSALGARVLARRAEGLGYSGSYGARHLARQTMEAAAWRRFLSRLESAPIADMDCATSGALDGFAFACSVFERTNESYCRAGQKC